ncbi:enolase-phosphatase E1-like [Salvia divinorum]|uniref:Enolase-phosphatase E1-like n=1 Tax=Salvia divinorum TaxID=28513 RepID=A0ABD1H6M3_SALDI
MDFDRLSRRELQAFCKRNKIPANMTNAAMANALKALDIVEGIDVFMQTSQSESGQSTIELLDSSEVTSPYVPPTAARSTRRRNALKDDAEDVTSLMTTTRRSTRRTAAKASNVAAMETPVVMAQASRRKVQIAPACLKMDSQLEECVEDDEAKDLMTPAAVGVASRRRRAEETEKRVYSTRRSVRLAVNNNVQMLSGEKSGESEILNNELFAKDCEDQEVDQKLSGVTGVDETENLEEDKEKVEVVSAEKEDITMGEIEMGSTREEETTTDFAVEVTPKDEICDNTEIEMGSTREEEMTTDFAVEVTPKDEICDNTEYLGHEEVVVLPVDVSDEVEESEGPVDVPTCEIEVTVESQDEASDFENKVVSDDEVEVACDGDKEVSAEDDQDLNVTLGKLTELKLQQEPDAVDLGILLPETETIQVEESEKTVARMQNSPSKQPSAVPVHEASAEMENKALLIEFKENMGSGTEMVIMQEDTTKAAKDSGESLRSYEEESLRKLSKMLKEKLQISSKSRKHGNEALPRSALQVLPVNRMVDGNGNHR